MVDGTTIAMLATVGMLVLLALGVPVAACLGLAGFTGLYFVGGWAFAVIQLEFSTGRQQEGRSMKSECYFAYDTVEETVITHVDELSAYATLPYRMTIDSKEVPKQILQRAVSDEQIEGLAEFMEKINAASRKLLSQ